MSNFIDIIDAGIMARFEAEPRRKYLGASSIGAECARKVQLQYLGATPKVTAQQLRTFDIGHCLEDLVAEWLRQAGLDLRTLGEDGEQFGFSTANGKIAGHVDGIIENMGKLPGIIEKAEIKPVEGTLRPGS